MTTPMVSLVRRGEWGVLAERQRGSLRIKSGIAASAGPVKEGFGIRSECSGDV